MSVRYVVGQPLNLNVTFTVAGTATDPTTVSLVVTDPSGSATTYTYAGSTITKTSTGVYTKTITLSSAGVWSYVWTGTGAAADIEDGTITVYAVDPQQGFYCTVEELKDRLNLTVTTKDDAVTTAIRAACRQIDGMCNRKFWLDSTAVARTFEPQSLYCLDLTNVTFSDIGSQTGLVIKTDSSGDGTFETTWQTTDYELTPYDAPYDGPEAKPWTGIRAVGSQTFPLLIATALTRRDRVQITAKWGWPAVPDAVSEASRILAARIFDRRNSPNGIGGTADFGPIRVTGEDRDVMNLLRPYRRMAALVA